MAAELTDGRFAVHLDSARRRSDRDHPEPRGDDEHSVGLIYRRRQWGEKRGINGVKQICRCVIGYVAL
jgi:hypothetical protein